MSATLPPPGSPAPPNLLMSAPPQAAPPAALPAAPRAAVAPAAVAPRPRYDLSRITRQGVVQDFGNPEPDAAVQKRDRIGKVMAQLAGFANDPDVSRADITSYLGDLLAKKQVTPEQTMQLLQSLPPDAKVPELQQWSTMMFHYLQHAGVHLHSAFPRELFPGQPDEQGAPEPQPQSEAAS